MLRSHFVSSGLQWASSLAEEVPHKLAGLVVHISTLPRPRQQKGKHVEHSLDFGCDMGHSGGAELPHEFANGIAEHLVGPVDEECWRPTSEVVKQYVHPIIIWIHSMEIGIDRDIPRKHVEGCVLGDRILAQRQAHLGREQ